MGKKFNKINKRSQYDDFEEEVYFSKKVKPKKQSFDDIEYMYDIGMEKQKATNKYQSKKKNKERHKKYDNWN